MQAGRQQGQGKAGVGCSAAGVKCMELEAGKGGGVNTNNSLLLLLQFHPPALITGCAQLAIKV